MKRSASAIVSLSAAFAMCGPMRGEPAPSKPLAPSADTAAPAAPTEAAQTAELPSEVDLRPQFRKYELAPRRQGRRNTCSVFTTAAAIEFALSKADDKGTPLSVEYLNWACNQTIGNRTEDRGQFFRDLLSGYDRYGICPEADMSYRRRFDPDLSPSEEASQQAAAIRKRDFQIHWIRRWHQKTGLNDDQVRQIEAVLAGGFPVAAGASHSRLLVGYRREAKQPGGGVFLTKDSGSGSFGEVSYEFAKTEMNDVFWVEPPSPKSK